MSKGLRRNFSITTNDFSLKYVLIPVLAVVMCMESLIHLLPAGGGCFFSAWMRAGPRCCITSDRARWPQGPSDLTHGGATPPLWCSAPDSTIHWVMRKHQTNPSLGQPSRCPTSIFQMAKVMRDKNKLRVCCRLEETKETQSQCQVDPGWTLEWKKGCYWKTGDTGIKPVRQSMVLYQCQFL